MKNDAIYPYYVYYLNSRLLEDKISRGSYALLLISSSSFEDFKYKFENDPEFSKSFTRDKRINEFLNKNN